jgi:hypothetical protein
MGLKIVVDSVATIFIAFKLGVYNIFIYVYVGVQMLFYAQQKLLNKISVKINYREEFSNLHLFCSVFKIIGSSQEQHSRPLHC